MTQTWRLALPLVLALLCGWPAMSLAFPYREAPMLEAMTRQGSLPSVAQRLPEQPLLVQPAETLGQYGGLWRMGLRGNRDHALILRTLGYENLVRWSPTWMQTVPNVAQSVTPSPDYTTYTFQLRKGMRWSDGAPFTADDILFWHRHVLSNPELSPRVPSWLLSDGKPVAVEKLDDHAVVFRFARPHGLFLQHLAHPSGAEPTSYPAHYLRQFHVDLEPENVRRLMAEEGHATWTALFESRLGKAGDIDDPSRWRNPQLPVLHAWVLENGYTPDASRVMARRNPYYWKVDPLGRQLPYIDRVQYTVGTQEQLERWAMQGEIDMQNRHLADEGRRKALEANRVAGDYRFFRTVHGLSSKHVLALNLTHRDPALRTVFQDVRVRQALSLAIDRAALPHDLLGGDKPYQVAPRPESPYHVEALARQHTHHDLDAANALLDEAGLPRGQDGLRRRPDGQPLRFTLVTQPEYLPVFSPLSAMWRQAGVEVAVKGLPRAELEAQVRDNRHDAVTAAGEGGLDVLLEHQHYLPVHEENIFGVGWRLWLRDPSHPLAQEPPPLVKEQARLLESLMTTGDPARQTEIMRRILELTAEQFPVMGLTLAQEGFGLVKNGMRNVPALMPNAWSYPTPAPTNPCQYFFTTAAP